MKYGERPPKSPAEILAQLDEQNAARLAEMRFRLTKDYGLDSESHVPSEMSIALGASGRVTSVTFKAKGLTVTYEVTPTQVREISRFSLNSGAGNSYDETESGHASVLEDAMAEEYKSLLNNYFADFPEQRPE
jgi:hypothetical protein